MEDFPELMPRHLMGVIQEDLKAFPVVALLGARQVGKSTLMECIVREGTWPARILTLDDFDILSAALRNPDDFVDALETPVVIDEVQRAPDLLRAVKRVVDRRRRRGQFLLTGSANLMTMRGLTESLAGRVGLLELLPLSQAEIQRCRWPSRIIDDLFDAEDAGELAGRLEDGVPKSAAQDLFEVILAGGYPDAVKSPSPGHRSRWFESYRRTYLERDLREVAQIQDLVAFGQLLTAVAATTGEVTNATRLSRDIGMSLNTVRRYLDLLETTYQIFRVQPYSINVRRRVVKTPKIYMTDTGLACHLVGASDEKVLKLQGRTGAILETLIAAELRKMISVSAHPTELFFWRTHSGHEVDFLLARGTRLAAIEVKLASSLRSEDFDGVRSARNAFEKRLGISVVLHAGTRVFSPEAGILAMPLRTFLGGRED